MMCHVGIHLVSWKTAHIPFQDLDVGFRGGRQPGSGGMLQRSSDVAVGHLRRGSRWLHRSRCPWSPQLRPVIFRSCAARGRTRVRRLQQCWPKVRVGSRVTPSSLNSSHPRRADPPPGCGSQRSRRVQREDQELRFLTADLPLK